MDRKMRLNKLKKIRGIQSTFPSKNGFLDIEIKSRRTWGKLMHIWEVSDTLLNDPRFRGAGNRKTRRQEIQ